MRKLFVVLVVGALLLVAALVSRSASAQGPAVGATDASAQPGQQGTSQLYANDVSAPGLGAWTIDIGYDPDVITVTACIPVEGSGACNPHYSAGVIRSAGADAYGLDGDPVLVEIEFTCAADSEGGTTLDVMPRDVSDATVGGPVLLDVEDIDGTVTCGAAGVSTPTPMPSVPHAGTGSGPGAPSWARVAAALIGVFIAGLAMFAAGARAFPRRLD